jgi:mRNA interferase MazF
MVSPGDVVILTFQGAMAAKARPAVVVSSDQYQRTRPDCVVALLTSNLRATTAPTDYLLLDWGAAGLHQPSAFRSYFNMAEAAGLLVIGRLSERDWTQVRVRLALTFDLNT